tara:strand:- start:925 stop:1218 length:294 start_codon:yes stop_codon:yes gene_type:complete
MFDMLNKEYLISIEKLHLIAGFSLVISGIMVYFIDGLEMALSWAVFGAMYISMSDIGEADMSQEKRKKLNHIIRRLFGYAGASFSVVLVFYYLKQLI